MPALAYQCLLLGENPKKVLNLHDSTIQRFKAYAISMHVPIFLWAITGYVIAKGVFYKSTFAAGLIALFCMFLIYLVERIVIATPKSKGVNIARLFIGLVMSVIGASAVDLVIFQKEIEIQLKSSGETMIRAEEDKKIEQQKLFVEKIRAEWMARQEAANCEANGTCGSRVRSVGPIYHELVKQAEILRKEYHAALSRVTELEDAKSLAIKNWQTSGQATEQAGLLTRIQALHDYINKNSIAAYCWLLFFLLILFFELTVVLVKFAFGSTVDDHINQVREQINCYRATAYLEASTSPTANAQRLLSSI